MGHRALLGHSPDNKLKKKKDSDKLVILKIVSKHEATFFFHNLRLSIM